MTSPTLHNGRSSIFGRLALGTLVPLALAAYHPSVTPLLGASRVAMAAEELSEEQLAEFQIAPRRGAAADEDILRPGDVAPAAEEGVEEPEDIGAAAPERAAAAPPAVVERVEPAPRPARTPDIAVLPGSGAAFFVQLAAFRSAARAERAWELFRREHGEVLGALEPTIEQAATDQGLPLHRVLVGPFESRGAAAEVCRALQEREQDCFLRRPA